MKATEITVLEEVVSIILLIHAYPNLIFILSHYYYVKKKYAYSAYYNLLNKASIVGNSKFCLASI